MPDAAPPKPPADYEVTYDQFWKPLLETDGALNLDQVKRELHDFHALISSVPIVYTHITGSQVSKPNTNADVVCALADDQMTKAVREATAGVPHTITVDPAGALVLRFDTTDNAVTWLRTNTNLGQFQYDLLEGGRGPRVVINLSRLPAPGDFKILA